MSWFIFPLRFCSSITTWSPCSWLTNLKSVVISDAPLYLVPLFKTVHQIQIQKTVLVLFTVLSDMEPESKSSSFLQEGRPISWTTQCVQWQSWMLFWLKLLTLLQTTNGWLTSCQSQTVPCIKKDVSKGKYGPLKWRTSCQHDKVCHVVTFLLYGQVLHNFLDRCHSISSFSWVPATWICSYMLLTFLTAA